MAWKCPHCREQVSDSHSRCPKCRRERPSERRRTDDDDDSLLNTAIDLGVGIAIGMATGDASDALDSVSGGGGDFGGGGADG